MISSRRVDRLRLFDFRKQGNAAARDLAHFGKVLRPLDKGQGHPVDFLLQNRIEVAPVLFGQGADAERRIGQADALLVGNPGAGDDAAADGLAVGSFGDQSQLAVIDQQAMAGLDSFENFRMRQEHAGIVARGHHCRRA